MPPSMGAAAGAGDQRHRARCRGGQPAHHPDGRQPAGRVREPGRGDGLPPRDVADRRRSQRRGPARARTRRAAAWRGRQLGLEDGPGLYPAAGRARPAAAAPAVAGTAGPGLPDPGRVGQPRATCSPRRRRGAWSTYCRAANWSGFPASATRRPWSSRSRSSALDRFLGNSNSAGTSRTRQIGV